MVKHGDFFKIPNKHWEFQAEKWPDWTTYFDAHISLSRNCDHAGLRLGFEICGCFVEFQIYDSRHWDHEKNAWCVYPEDKFHPEED